MSLNWREVYEGHAGHLRYGRLWEVQMSRVLQRAKARGIDTQAHYGRVMKIATRLCALRKKSAK